MKCQKFNLNSRQFLCPWVAVMGEYWLKPAHNFYANLYSSPSKFMRVFPTRSTRVPWIISQTMTLNVSTLEW
jgi:hypothetical protein